MHSIQLELSPVELKAMRAALCDYAVLAYRQGRDANALGVRNVARAWTAHEVAAVELLSRLPPASGRQLVSQR